MQNMHRYISFRKASVVCNNFDSGGLAIKECHNYALFQLKRKKMNKKRAYLQANLQVARVLCRVSINRGLFLKVQ